MNHSTRHDWKYAAIIVLAISLFAFAPSVHAGEEASDSRFVQRHDQDNDGRVSEMEFNGPKACFERLDEDGDGFVAGDEAPRRRHRPGHGFMLKRMDTDGDGRISAEEYRAFALARFERMDQNGDGFIDAGEMPVGKGRRSCRHQ